MATLYPIFVPLEHIDEEFLSFYEVTDWCRENLKENSPNAYWLTQEDIHLITNRSHILHIINEESGSQLSEGNGGYIINPEVKQQISERLYFAKERFVGRELEIVAQLVKMFDVAIKTKKNIYFCF
ncbi:hypothetical protein LX64_02428 [Chitinophaga skermanii]|uniref:Uncharacterized protein n=1 Tax=Chitinophaga skermanii TaxID=331697 RepID=A0A327QPJ8_9BACT|nr:hypothetical protein [Chitinophaga skermanii]RAJ05273.1 hypothetical protein LX64_02428 [Chitinophaga skermanii]